MTSPDDGLISLDDLFAAVGVSAPAGSAPSASPAGPQSHKDTTEQDLLSALGISRAAAPEEQTASTVDAPEPGEPEQVGSQRDRARQWRQELEAAEQRTAAAAPKASADQPAHPSVSALPALSSNAIQPFGASMQPARIGVLEGPAQFQMQQAQPVQGMLQLSAGASSGQAAAPFAQQMQGQQQPHQAQAAQGAQQAPQAAFQRAQQLPLQPLQPVDAAPGSIQPMQQPPLPHQALQQLQESAPMRPLEHAMFSDAAAAVPASASDQQVVSHQGTPQPLANEASPHAMRPFQPASVAPWQQQMAQQVSAVHAAAVADHASSEAQPQQHQQFPSPVLAQAQAQGQMQALPLSAQAQPDHVEPFGASEEAADAPQAAQAPMASELSSPSAPTMPQAPVPEGMQAQPASPAPSTMSGTDVVFQQPSFATPAPAASGVLATPDQGASAIQPPTGEALEDLERGQASSKVAQIVGAILIFIAVVCVAFAVCLLTGVMDLSAFNAAKTEQSSAADSQLSSQASPSATTPSDGTADQPAMTSRSGSKAGQVVYSYVVRGVDGGTHEAMETATFGEDGKLTSSTLEIQAESQMDAEKLLDQLKQEFGESLTEGEATDAGVTCTVVLPRDDLDRESYTELLSTNAPEFKIVSQ